MSETPEQPTQPVVSRTTEPAIVETESARRRPNRVVTAAAWVGIVAGTVFVVAVVFFSGFILGRHSDSGRFDGGPPRHHEMMFRDGPAMRPGPFTGPAGPGMYGPGQMGPGNAGPAQPTPPSPPARP